MGFFRKNEENVEGEPDFIRSGNLLRDYVRHSDNYHRKAMDILKPYEDDIFNDYGLSGSYYYGLVRVVGDSSDTFVVEVISTNEDKPSTYITLRYDMFNSRKDYEAEQKKRFKTLYHDYDVWKHRDEYAVSQMVQYQNLAARFTLMGRIKKFISNFKRDRWVKKQVRKDWDIEVI